MQISETYPKDIDPEGKVEPKNIKFLTQFQIILGDNSWTCLWELLIRITYFLTLPPASRPYLALWTSRMKWGDDGLSGEWKGMGSCGQGLLFNDWNLNLQYYLQIKLFVYVITKMHQQDWKRWPSSNNFKLLSYYQIIIPTGDNFNFQINHLIMFEIAQFY